MGQTYQHHKIFLGLVLSLALLRGWMYASFLPPWGLLDEQQHVHYVQHLAKQGSVPIVGETYLSPEIIDSTLDTHRHQFFHWPPLPSRDPELLGLEGHSYEGYQPPLFYLVLTPLFSLSNNLLLTVYLLKFAGVFLSLITVWLAYKTAIELFPQQRWFPITVALLLVLLPERTMAVSRVNNDVLLEGIAAAFIWLSTRTILSGLSLRRCILLGLLFGAGVLTKISMLMLGLYLLFVFWARRGDRDRPVFGLVTIGLVTLLIAPLLLRNLWLYGNLTGFAGFRALTNFSAPPLAPDNLAWAVVDLFRHFWVIWWQGSQVGENFGLNGLYLVLAALTGLSLVKSIRFWSRSELRQRQVLMIYAISLGAYAIAIVVSYFNGTIPIIQGRFFLPVILPAVILWTWGLWQHSRATILLLLACGVLILMDSLSLFGNLLSYFYFWSAFSPSNPNPTPIPTSWLTAWHLFYGNFLSDKPLALRPILPWLPPVYALALVLTIGWYFTLLVRTYAGQNGALPPPAHSTKQPEVSPLVEVR